MQFFFTLGRYLCVLVFPCNLKLLGKFILIFNNFFVIALIALRIAASMVEVLIKWDVQETYILRYLLHCHEESESYTTWESRCLDSGLEKLIREPQSAQNTIPANRCELCSTSVSFFRISSCAAFCALSHVSWSMIASWVFLNIILFFRGCSTALFQLEVLTDTFT